MIPHNTSIRLVRAGQQPCSIEPLSLPSVLTEGLREISSRWHTGRTADCSDFGVIYMASSSLKVS